jgi:CxxC motif-containing protein (DUF1111 family)
MVPRQEAGPHDFFEPRQTPTTLGLGAIDSIPGEVIMANADPDDEDGDGIAGIAHVLPDGRVGRLGWKGGVPSVHEFVRDALSNEVGLTLPAEEGYTFGFATDDDDIADPEVDPAFIDAISFYIENLAPPTPTAEVPEGEAVFEEVGCANCHIPTLEGEDGPVHLYSDLLLHAVLKEGELGIPNGMATEHHFRTSPLWGISETAPYMHDGRASTLEDAIEAHHGEAEASREAYQGLSAADREKLLEFLGSL